MKVNEEVKNDEKKARKATRSFYNSVIGMPICSRLRKVLQLAGVVIVAAPIILSAACGYSQPIPQGSVEKGNIDSDNDGINDKDELKYGLDPNKPNPAISYAIKSNPGFYSTHTNDSILREFERNMKLGEDGKWTIDEDKKWIIDKIPTYPSLYEEIRKLPDLAIIDGNDVESIKSIFGLYADSRYKDAFNTMFKEGIPEKRKYCTSLQALLWECYDNRDVSGLLENFSIEKFINDAWKNTTTSGNYKSDKWGNFDEVVDRLNFPVAAYIYLKDNIKYQFDTGPGSWLTAKELFDRKIGDCEDYATFTTYSLLRNGYKDGLRNNETNVAFSVDVGWLKPGMNKDSLKNIRYENLSPVQIYNKNCEVFTGGHIVPVVKTEGKIYCFDSTDVFTDRGPFNSIEDLADKMSYQIAYNHIKWFIYAIAGGEPWDDLKTPISKPFGTWDGWVWRR